jgi:DNA-binding LytR/AlgR family response regulator
MSDLSLKGIDVLVVEDDYFIASDLEQALASAGARVVGPFSRAEQARDALAGGKTVSAAVLDINIAGTMVYPLAEELRSAGIPLVFATGYDASVIPAQFTAVPRLVKPIERHRLVQALASVVGLPS